MFHRIDPIGLWFAPSSVRTGEIVVPPRLDGASSLEDVRRVLKEEFTRWFGQKLSDKPQPLFKISNSSSRRSPTRPSIPSAKRW